MESSSAIKSKIDELDKIRNQVNGVLSKFSPCSTVLSKSQKYIDEITINGEAIDQGKLKEVEISLNNAENDLQAIVSECDGKIEILIDQYAKAVAREEEEREAARRRRASAATNIPPTR